MNTLEMAVKHLFDNGGAREEDFVALLELVSVVFEKLDFCRNDDDLEAVLSRVPNMSQPEKLSELIVQLFRTYRENGDVRVFTDDMQPLGLNVSTPGPVPDERDDALQGQRYLCIGGRVAG